MTKPTSRPSDLSERWEVRLPLRYGSRHHAYFLDEQTARAEAEKIAREKYDDAGLTIITRSRTVYIDHDDNI